MHPFRALTRFAAAGVFIFLFLVIGIPIIIFFADSIFDLFTGARTASEIHSCIQDIDTCPDTDQVVEDGFQLIGIILGSLSGLIGIPLSYAVSVEQINSKTKDPDEKIDNAKAASYLMGITLLLMAFFFWWKWFAYMSVIFFSPLGVGLYKLFASIENTSHKNKSSDAHLNETAKNKGVDHLYEKLTNFMSSEMALCKLVSVKVV